MMGCMGPFMRERGKARSRAKVLVGVVIRALVKVTQKGAGHQEEEGDPDHLALQHMSECTHVPWTCKHKRIWPPML